MLFQNSARLAGLNAQDDCTKKKRRLTDVLDYDGVVLLAKSFPNTRASRFVEWFTNSDETIDGKSKSKA